MDAHTWDGDGDGGEDEDEDETAPREGHAVPQPELQEEGFHSPQAVPTCHLGSADFSSSSNGGRKGEKAFIS